MPARDPQKTAALGAEKDLFADVDRDFGLARPEVLPGEFFLAVGTNELPSGGFAGEAVSNLLGDPSGAGGVGGGKRGTPAADLPYALNGDSADRARFFCLARGHEERILSLLPGSVNRWGVQMCLTDHKV